MSESIFGNRPIANGDNLLRKYGYLPALGAFAAAVAIDNSTWLIDRRRQSTEASIETHQHPGAQAIYTLPGCRMDGQNISTMLEPQLSQFGDTNYLTYPQRGFSIESIKHRLLESRSHDKDRPATVYANSMGGVVLSKLLADEDFRHGFGDIDTLIFDSSPSSEQDIRRPVRMAIGAAAVLKSSWTASRLSGEVLHRWALRYKEHDPYISKDQLLTYRQITAATPLHVTYAQSEFIRKAKLETGSLAGVAENIYYVQSERDEVVNTEQALEGYQAIFDTDIKQVIDKTRPHGSHAAGPEFQTKIVELISKSQLAKPLA